MSINDSIVSSAFVGKAMVVDIPLLELLLQLLNRLLHFCSIDFFWLLINSINQRIAPLYHFYLLLPLKYHLAPHIGRSTCPMLPLLPL